MLSQKLLLEIKKLFSAAEKWTWNYFSNPLLIVHKNNKATFTENPRFQNRWKIYFTTVLSLFLLGLYRIVFETSHLIKYVVEVCKLWIYLSTVSASIFCFATQDAPIASFWNDLIHFEEDNRHYAKSELWRIHFQTYISLIIFKIQGAQLQ